MNNNEKKLISVIIPILNGEETLLNCLNSVLRQETENDYEVIVVDNGSTDKTADLIKSLALNNGRIKFVYELVLGRGRARNAGLDMAQGEIIVMTDVDCVVEKNWLKNLTQPLINNEAQAVLGFEKDAVNNYWSRQRQADDWRFLKTKIRGNIVNHVDTKNFAIHGQLLKELRFDSSLKAYEDWDLFIRLQKRGIDVLYLPDVSVYHRHDSSICDLAKTQYARAIGLATILRKYKNDEDFKNVFKDDENAKSVNVRNFILFIPWAIWQLISRPKQALYLIIADFFWKLGLISSYFKRRFY